MAFKHNPNVADRTTKALKVPCGYCKSPVGEMCWALRSVNGTPVEQTYAPHKRRVKDAMLKRMADKKKVLN